MVNIIVTTSDYYDANGIRNLVWDWVNQKRVKYLSDDELNTIISILAEEYPDGIDEAELNDFFWLEDNTYADWLGWDDVETFWEDHQDEYR